MAYLFFYGKAGENGFLSNFYRTNFSSEGLEFHSVEQYMHYKKAKLFKDEEIAEQIMLEKTPLATKRLGRKVKNFDPSIWNENKKNIVKYGVLLKFKQNKEISEKLLNTQSLILVEAAGGRNADRIWGIGYTAKLALENKDNWGENLLGKILMEVRNEVKE
jgi:ribA/ribD-fused uncharacterized protein